MAVTSLSDVINPEVFTPYVINRTMELSALFQAGIVGNDQQFNELANSPGPTVTMPFWSDLTGESEAMTEDAITAGNISANADVAVIIRRVKAWGATGLSGVLAGDDPMRAIGDLVAGFWARDMQKELIAVLTGALGAESASTNVHDVSADATDPTFSVGNFVDAQAKLGDASSLLTGVVMHSAVYHFLKKAEQIDTERDSSGKDFETYDGRRVIVDDSCPLDTGVYTSYLFGAGAVALGNGNPPTIKSTEVYRNAMTGSGEDVLINRRNFILHPRGIKFSGTLASSAGPTRVELSTTTNWSRVYEAKQIRIVAFKHTIE